MPRPAACTAPNAIPGRRASSRRSPKELVREVRPKVTVSRPVAPLGRSPTAKTETPTGFRLGQRVKHNTFGEGVILNYEGEGPQARVQVNFEKKGNKWLAVAYANLQTL